MPRCLAGSGGIAHPGCVQEGLLTPVPSPACPLLSPGGRHPPRPRSRGAEPRGRAGARGEAAPRLCPPRLRELIPARRAQRLAEHPFVLPLPSPRQDGHWDGDGVSLCLSFPSRPDLPQPRRAARRGPGASSTPTWAAPPRVAGLYKPGLEGAQEQALLPDSRPEMPREQPCLWYCSMSLLPSPANEKQQQEKLTSPLPALRRAAGAGDGWVRGGGHGCFFRGVQHRDGERYGAGSAGDKQAESVSLPPRPMAKLGVDPNGITRGGGHPCAVPAGTGTVPSPAACPQGWGTSGRPRLQLWCPRAVPCHLRARLWGCGSLLGRQRAPSGCPRAPGWPRLAPLKRLSAGPHLRAG